MLMSNYLRYFLILVTVSLFEFATVVGPGYIKVHIISNSKPFPLDLPLSCLLLAVMKGGVEILPVTSCYRNWDKLRLDGPLG